MTLAAKSITKLAGMTLVLAFLGVLPESLHVGDGTGDSDVIVVAEVFEVGVGGG